jgi:hypothetical protein
MAEDAKSARYNHPAYHKMAATSLLTRRAPLLAFSVLHCRLPRNSRPAIRQTALNRVRLRAVEY